jgi:hypothetical protein
VRGARTRNLLLLALLAAVGYWYLRDQPTLSQFVDDLTQPLLGSKAAVKESEHKRVVGDAATVLGQQTDENVGTLHEGMTTAEVRDLLGSPDRIETVSNREPIRVRWTYRTVKRTVLFEDGVVISIAIL